MYFYKLLEEEQKLKVEIETIELSIELMRDYPGQFPGIRLSHNNLDDAYAALGDVKNRLNDVHNRMRKFILGE